MTDSAATESVQEHLSMLFAVILVFYEASFFKLAALLLL